MLDTHREIHSTYDLKGSSLGRDAKPGEKVLKDNDLADRQGKLHLGSQRAAFLQVTRPLISRSRQCLPFAFCLCFVGVALLVLVPPAAAAAAASCQSCLCWFFLSSLMLMLSLLLVVTVLSACVELSAN